MKRWLAAGLSALLVLAVILSGVNVQIKPPDGGNQIVTIHLNSVDAAGVADFTFDGTNDDVQLNQALAALPATGGRLVIGSAVQLNLTALTTVTRAISNVTIEGTGRGTYLVGDGVTATITAGGNNWVINNIRTDAVGINMGATTGWQWNNVTINATFYAYRTTAGAESVAVPTGRSSGYTIASSASNALVRAQADYIYDQEDIVLDEILTCLTAANATGIKQTVTFLPGTYIDRTKRVLKPLLVTLMGYGAVLKVKSGLNTNVKNVIEFAAGDHKSTGVYGFEIDGNLAGNPTYTFDVLGSGIYDAELNQVAPYATVGISSNAIIKDCYIHDTCRSNIIVEGDYQRVEGNRLVNSFTDHLIYVAGGDFGIYDNNRLEGYCGGHVIFANGECLLDIDGTSIGTQFSNTVIDNLVAPVAYVIGIGVSFGPTSHLSFNGLTIYMPVLQKVSVFIHDSSFVDITGYNYYGRGVDRSLQIDNSSYVTISGSINALSFGDPASSVISLQNGSNRIDLSALNVACTDNANKALMVFEGAAAISGVIAPKTYTQAAGGAFLVEERAFSGSSIGVDIRNTITSGVSSVQAGAYTNVVYYGSRSVDSFTDVLAADTNYIVVAEALNAATPITCALANQPDHPRNLTWVLSHANITAFSITFTYITSTGTSTTATVTQAAGWSGTLTVPVSKVTSIIMTSRTGTGVGDTLDVGIGSLLGLSSNTAYLGDVYKVVKNGVDYATASYTTVSNLTYTTVDVSTGGAIVDLDDFSIWYRASGRVN